jgi:hypothetical protein
MTNVRLSSRVFAGFTALALMVGCGSSAPSPIGVAVTPTTATLVAGATQTFTATVTNDGSSPGVTWTASAGTITSGGVYTAPAPVPATAATITATSKTDTTQTATASVTFTPIGVAITTTPVAMVAGATQTFAATVTGDTTLNAGVTWSASVGSVTAAGVYTAPTPVPATAATITATSKSDTTKTATASVTFTPVGVAITTTPVAMVAGAIQTFAATVTGDTALNAGVTWSASVGSITASGVYTAPTPVSVASATITATSKTDTTKAATATVTLTPIAVSVSPTTATLIGGASTTIVATVTGDTTLNAGVTWTASTGSITATGVYTAPAVIGSTTSATVTATSKTDTTKTATATITLTPISVSITTVPVAMVAGATQTFAATVTSDGTSAGVTWTASVGSITALGVYTAPTPVSVASATITATSKTDTTKNTTATVTLTPIVVTVSPTTATVIGGASTTIVATVTGDTALNAGVTWTASTGSITALGVYTAPAVIGSTTSTTVTATSKTDTTKTATATITLTPISLNAISPLTASMGNSGSQAFTDTVNNDGSSSGVSWSIGSGAGTLTASTTSSVTYNAPATAIGSVTTVTLTATGIKDNTKTTTATITLNPISVSIPTTPVAMIGGATQTFSATIANDGSNSGVTWSVTSGGGSFSPTTTLTGVSTTYTSASPVTAATAVIKATSVKDPTRSASVTVTLTPIGISFTTSTTGITLDSGQTLALGAAVTNDSSASGATFATTGAGSVSPSSPAGNTPATTLTATGTTASSVTVTATSNKDGTKTVATSAITVNPAITFSTASGALTAGTTNTAYAGATIAASGGTGIKSFVLASGALPAGLSISNAGAISGTITGAAGTSTFTVKATDTATTPVTVTSGAYTITVTATPIAWTTPASVVSLPAATVGTAITPYTLATTGGTGAITYSLSGGVLPAGITLNGTTGVLSGTPTAPTVVAGNVLSFKATDSASTPVTSISPTVTLIVNPVTLVIPTQTLPVGTVGAPYSYQLTSTGGTGTVNWSLSAGSLTGTGLTLSSGGLLSGTPLIVETGLSLTFQAQDTTTNQQQTKTAILPLNINNTLTITTNQSTLTPAYPGVAYPSTTLAASGGSGTGYTWSVTSGLTGTNSLATLNLAVSAGGIITGTPATTGTANFTVQVTDSGSHTATSTYTITAYTPLTLPAGPTPGTLPAATTTAIYTGSINSLGGVGPTYTWTVNGTNASSAVTLGNGTMQAVGSGSTLNISGTPTAAGTITLNVSVKDSANTTVGPITYTIAVTSNYSVGGSVSLNNGCTGGSNLPTYLLTLTQGSTTIGTATTDSTTGNFSIANVPNGTYTLTPSFSGPTGSSAVFYPATKSVTVNNANIPNAGFGAAVGFTVTGTVSYSGIQTVSQANPIYLSLTGGCTNGNPGTSLPATGPYSIHGVPRGTYTLQAFQDNLGFGSQNASNPLGVAFSVNAGQANANVTLADPAAVTLTTAPTLQVVAGFNNGVLAQPKPITNSSGEEMATSYTLQWSTTQTFTVIAGSKTFPATGTGGGNIWFVNSAMTTGCTNCSTLTNGSTYYFRASGTSAGTPTSAYGVFASGTPAAPVLVTIGAPTGGVTVSGSVTYPGTATGPMYVGFFNYSTGAFYGQYIQNPISAQAYTIQVPIASTYYFISIVDNSNTGILRVGDFSDLSNSGNPPTANITAATSNQNLTLAGGNSVLQEYTGHIIYPGSPDSYQVNANVSPGLKLPVSAEVISATNPDVIVPQDIALCTTCSSPVFQWRGSTSTAVPATGDSYGIKVTYSDGSSDASLPATVGAVLTSAAAATTLSPTTGTSISTTPSFSWTYPVSASSYTYQFWISQQTGGSGNIWQIPANNSKTSGFTNSQITPPLVWGTDPTSSSNPPTGPLTLGTTYNWTLQTIDTNNNYVQTTVNYNP